MRFQDDVLTHPGQRLPASIKLSVCQRKPYVSRGGEKLAGALSDFNYRPEGLRCLDVGASTGGFCDCLLKANAAAVTAVDVGYGQFDFALRNDPRVTLYERTNIYKVEPNSISAPFNLIVADVSFSSLARLLPVLEACGETKSDLIALCKPQFELPKAFVKAGVVRESSKHIQALEQVIQAAQNTCWGLQALTYSHLRGPKGNIEFFFWATWGANPATIDADIVVHQAHRNFATQMSDLCQDLEVTRQER